MIIKTDKMITPADLEAIQDIYNTCYSRKFVNEEEFDEALEKAKNAAIVLANGNMIAIASVLLVCVDEGLFTTEFVFPAIKNLSLSPKDEDDFMVTLLIKKYVSDSQQSVLTLPLYLAISGKLIK